MRVLGIDPGTAVTGFGLVECRHSSVNVIHYESLHLRSSQPLTARLKSIYDKCSECIAEFRPEMLAVETAFYGKNIQSTLKLGQARGVAIIAGLNSELAVFEYSPREVKRSVTGNGASSKQQVHYMVKAILGIREELNDYDCTDALAVALCHVYASELFARHDSGDRSESWKKYVENNPERVIAQKAR